MAIVQSTVPDIHLATQMGKPNQLVINYTTDILIPVPGPYMVTLLRRDFVNGLMLLNDFLDFVEDVQNLVSQKVKIDLPIRNADMILPKNYSRFDKELSSRARFALNELLLQASQSKSKIVAVQGKSKIVVAQPKNKLVTDLSKNNFFAEQEGIQLSKKILLRLSSTSIVFREMLEQGLIQPSGNILSDQLLKATSFSKAFSLVVPLLNKSIGAKELNPVPQALNDITSDAIETANRRYTDFLGKEFKSLSPDELYMLIKWLVGYHVSKQPNVAAKFENNYASPFGFKPVLSPREWAFSRKEKLRLEFGTPTLRGPLGAEPVAPQGYYRREDFSSIQTELTQGSSQAFRSKTTEVFNLSTSDLRRELNSIHHSGSGSLAELSNQASNNIVNEERRQLITSRIQEVSEARENMTISTSTQVTSSTITREAKGIDPKKSATHHRFKVVIPIKSTIEMYDLGLTWSPLLINPFIWLRVAIKKVYDEAYVAHLRQYYVPEPVMPQIVWDSYTVYTDKKINKSNEAVVEENWEIRITPSDRQDHPDLNSCTVAWNQSESWTNDDPDHFTARPKNLSYSGGVIKGTVRLETDDGGSDWQGFAHVEVRILRYSQETITALAQHELNINDFNLKRQALESQAHQFARIKEREFIERHEQLEPLLKLLFYELMRRISATGSIQHISYYKEILSGCINWKGVKIDFEPVQLNLLAYPDFPADHFVNSIHARLFLPINKGSETNFFDALTACGTFQVRQSVTDALAALNNARTRLQNGPETLDQFDSEMIIGEHIESVLSERDFSS